MITDTRMAWTGIRRSALEKFGSETLCLMDDSGVARSAKTGQTTRAHAAVDAAIAMTEGGIYVVGNAPTALLRLLELMEKGHATPGLVISLPVGFVNASESKAPW